MPHVMRKLKEPAPRKHHLTHRLITPDVIRQEHLTLLAESEHPDAYRRAASRLNLWVSQGPPDDDGVKPIETL